MARVFVSRTATGDPAPVSKAAKRWTTATDRKCPSSMMRKNHMGIGWGHVRNRFRKSRSELTFARFVRDLGGGVLAAVPEAVAVAAHLQYIDVVAEPVQNPERPLPGNRCIHLNRRTLPGELIHGGQAWIPLPPTVLSGTKSIDQRWFGQVSAAKVTIPPAPRRLPWRRRDNWSPS